MKFNNFIKTIVLVAIVSLVAFLGFGCGKTDSQSKAEIKIYNGGQIEFTYDDGYFQRLENNLSYVIEVKRIIAPPETIIITVWPIHKGKQVETSKSTMKLKGNTSKDLEKYKKLTESLEKNGACVSYFTNRIVDEVTETTTYIY